MTTSLPSVFEADPPETGGVANRQGGDFQDHVAAKYCLEMLDSDGISEVWHEYQDDVTVIHGEGENAIAEYIQVKKTDESLWSLAVVTQRDIQTNKKTNRREKIIGSSVMEKNLANDSKHHKSLFRIVTAKEVADDLKLLKYPRDSIARKPSSPKMIKLIDALTAKVGDYKSAKGNGCDFWAYSVVWDVYTSAELLASHNKVVLRRVAEKHKFNLLNVECDAVYLAICERVRKAGRIEVAVSLDGKKLKRIDFETDFKEMLTAAKIPSGILDGINEYDISLDYLKEIITGMHEVLNSDDYLEAKSDFQLIDMKDKNRINGMSEEFYEDLKSNYHVYFDRIKSFLSKPLNIDLNDAYFDLANEINMLLSKYRGSVKDFDDFIYQLCKHLSNNTSADLGRKKRYVWFLISYMYFNCDIGRKA